LTARPVVAFDDLSVRPATRNDAAALAGLRCGDADYAREVERFVHEKALSRHLNAGHMRHHRLLVFWNRDARIVGCAAHRPADIPFPPGTNGRERGTRLVFVALDISVQGHDLPTGTPVSHRLMALLLDDVARVGPGRLVDGTVDERNTASLGLCRRFGLDPVQRDQGYVQVLGALPAR
jgi:hypothetical protein